MPLDNGVNYCVVVVAVLVAVVVVAAGETITVVLADTEPPIEVAHVSVNVVDVASASVRTNPSAEPEETCIPAPSFTEHPIVPTLAHTSRTELPVVVRAGSARSDAIAGIAGVVVVVVVVVAVC